MAFNFGNWMNDNIFKTNELKQITGGIGSIFGKGLSFMEGMSNNILNMSKGLTNMLSSPFLMRSGYIYCNTTKSTIILK